LKALWGRLSAFASSMKERTASLTGALMERARLAGSGIRGAMSRKKRTSHFTQDEKPSFEESPGDSRSAPASASPGLRVLAAFFSAMARKKGFIAVSAGSGGLGLCALATALIIARPLPKAPMLDPPIANRELLLSLEVPAPPLPYSQIILSRDPGLPPSPEEEAAWETAVSPELAKRWAAAASDAVDAFFKDVR